MDGAKSDQWTVSTVAIVQSKLLSKVDVAHILILVTLDQKMATILQEIPNLRKARGGAFNILVLLVMN